MNTPIEYMEGIRLQHFEKLIQSKYKKRFDKYEIHKLNHYHYETCSDKKTFIYLVEYFYDYKLTKKFAEWQYDSKRGIFLNT